MPDPDLPQLWARITEQFELVMQSLGESDDARCGMYREFLDHNELGLAFDVLVDVAAAVRADRHVWEKLYAVAAMMDIEEDDDAHGSSVRQVKERLTAQ